MKFDILKKIKASLSASFLAVSISAGFATPSFAFSEPFLGQLMPVGFNFCPRGWARAEGQILSISDNTALFSLLGTTYGGDGRTSFGLPDLRGRSLVGVGTGPGLTSMQWGQRHGQEQTSLHNQHLPNHNHAITNGTVVDPALGAGSIGPVEGFPSAHTQQQQISNAGGGQSFSVRDPYLAIYWCIATTGIFPSRS